MCTLDLNDGLEILNISPGVIFNYLYLLIVGK